MLFPSPGDLPGPGTEPRSPILQADSLPFEPPGKPFLFHCLNSLLYYSLAFSARSLCGLLLSSGKSISWRAKAKRNLPSVLVWRMVGLAPHPEPLKEEGTPPPACLPQAPSAPWVRKGPWRRAWQPSQCSCLESPMDRGAWRATAHRVEKSWI